MKYTALVAVVAAVVSIPLVAGLAVAMNPTANTLSMTPQENSGNGMMHMGGNGFQCQHQENPDDCPMYHNWEHCWDYNYSYNYSGSNCPCM